MTSAKEPEDAEPRAPYIHGKTIDENGKIRFLSVSSVEKADSSHNGCEREWWYQYKMGLKEPPSEAQKRGTKLHAEVAEYLITGIKALSTPILTNLHMVPEPGPDLHVEKPIAPILVGPNGEEVSGLHLSPLRANGVPFVGAIDLMHERGTNKGALDIEDMRDPPNTVEVLDWKFVKDLRFIKTGPELLKTHQMPGYGKYVFAIKPETEFVRLSHGNIPRSGPGRKVTIRVGRDAIEKSWEHTESVVRSIQHIAAETDPEKVPANTRVCHRFGRDCIHRAYCTAGKHNSLASIIGTKRAEAILQGKTMSIVPKSTSSLLSRIQAGASTPTTPKVDPAEIERLKAEEKAARLKALIPPGFVEACQAVVEFGRGFPTLKGAAAKALAAAEGEESADGYVFEGKGELAQVEIDDPALMPQVVTELTEARDAQPDANVSTMGALPPDAPASDPALASEKSEDAPPAPIAAPTSTPTPTAANPLASVAAEKPKRSSKKKPDPATSVGASVVLDASTIETPTADDGTVIELYVDCVPYNATVRRFEPVIKEILDGLCELEGIPDVRIADPNGKLGFGRWKGALAAALREKVIPGGRYVLDARFSEFGEVAAEAMRDRTDVKYTRGVR